ncbi:MAG: DUF5681 domain-containing protein [Candidatus Competibacteraceae bacterium]
MTFRVGQFGNPSGRPRGVGKHARFRELLYGRANALLEKLVALALEGDSTALKLCIERLLQPTREDPVKLKLTGSLSEQGAAVLRSLGKGELIPSQASQILQGLANQARLIEIDELEARVRALEAKNGD